MAHDSARTLTDDDISAITEAFKHHSACNLGLTTEEVSALKKFLKAFNGAATLIGVLVLTAVVGGTIALVSRGFWVSVASGVKSGGGQ